MGVRSFSEYDCWDTHSEGNFVMNLKGDHSKGELSDNAKLTMRTQKLLEMRKKQLQDLNINNLNCKQQLSIL